MTIIVYTMESDRPKLKRMLQTVFGKTLVAKYGNAGVCGEVRLMVECPEETAPMVRDWLVDVPMVRGFGG